MAYSLSPEQRKHCETMLEKATPYTEADPEYNMWDGDVDPDRMAATLAKKFLDGANGNA